MAETLAELFGAADKGAGGDVETFRAPAPSSVPVKVDRRAQRIAWGDVGQSLKRGRRRPGQRTWKDGPGRWWSTWESMESGRWYVAREVPGLAQDAAKLVRRGAAVRTLHPDWNGRWQDGPKWLYQRVEGIRKPVYAKRKRISAEERRRNHEWSVVAWQKRNPDRVAEYRRRTYERNREWNLARGKAYRDANRDARNAWKRARYRELRDAKKNASEGL